MEQLKAEYGDKFSQVFKTITVDSGSEFADLSAVELWGTGIYFAHPYASWERPRKKLGYRTPEELFDAFLDRVYAT